MTNIAMHYEEKQVTRTVGFLTIDGKRFTLGDVRELIACVSGSDCEFVKCIPDNYTQDDLAEILEKHEVVFICTRGSVRPGKLFMEFVKEAAQAAGDGDNWRDWLDS